MTDTPDAVKDADMKAELEAVLADDAICDAQKRVKLFVVVYKYKKKCYDNVKLEACNLDSDQVDLDKLNELKPVDPATIPNDPSILLTDLKDPKLIADMCDKVNKECERCKEAIQSN